jgi:hypothetical protein
VYATLLLVSLRDSPNTNFADLIGQLVGAALMLCNFAILGHFMRRGAIALFRLMRRGAAALFSGASTE